MRIFVVDDEPLARERLVRIIEKHAEHEVVGQAGDGVSALHQIQEHKPDIVLLDIRMPGMDGLEVARHLCKLEHPPAVVFCTAYDQYAMQAFDVQAVGYLLKPVRRDALVAALENAVRANQAQLAALGAAVQETGPAHTGRTHLSVRSHRGIQLVPVSDIQFFMADQKYVRVVYSGGEVLIDEPLKELEIEFGARFVRVHRNALIAIHLVDALERDPDGQNFVRLRGVEERVPVSRRSVPALRKKLL